MSVCEMYWPNFSISVTQASMKKAVFLSSGLLMSLQQSWQTL